MKQADEKRITVRYKVIDEEAIEVVKDLTNEQTSSKAILAVVHEYPGLCNRVADLRVERDNAIAELGHCRRVLQNYTQALNQLHGLADKLVNDSLQNGG